MSLTGMVDKRTLEKYEREAREKSRESWYLSWALDTNQEGKHYRLYYRLAKIRPDGNRIRDLHLHYMYAHKDNSTVYFKAKITARYEME